MVPPADGGPIGGWPHVSRSGLARLGHEGVLNRSLSDPSPRVCLPWETLPGAFKPQTTYPRGSFEHSNPSTTLRWRHKEGVICVCMCTHTYIYMCVCVCVYFSSILTP
ncbi:hypothetical protein GOODEAATRI_004573 [Goodea atripinnis]|uniref:Uncharacterized protein n=1 Tax=Goodea atripinnis TaxID=208336 RepID=A0ABV0PKV9_9TELE